MHTPDYCHFCTSQNRRAVPPPEKVFLSWISVSNWLAIPCICGWNATNLIRIWHLGSNSNCSNHRCVCEHMKENSVALRLSQNPNEWETTSVTLHVATKRLWLFMILKRGNALLQEHHLYTAASFIYSSAHLWTGEITPLWAINELASSGQLLRD